VIECDERLLREKIANRSANPEDYLELAGLLYSAGRADECLEVTRNALRDSLTALDRARLLTWLGWDLGELKKDYDQAISVAEEAIALTDGDGSVEGLTRRALALEMLSESVYRQDPEKSKEVALSSIPLFEQVLASTALSDGLKYDACRGAGRAYAMTGDSEKSAKLTEEAVRLASNRRMLGLCLSFLAFVQREQGRLEDARGNFAKAIKGWDGRPAELAMAYRELGWTEQTLGKLPEARAKLQKALSIIRETPGLDIEDVPLVTRSIADISFELADYEGAVEGFRSAVDLCSEDDSMHWNGLLWLAAAQRELDQLAAARATLESIVAAPKTPGGERENAIQDLRSVKVRIAGSILDRGEFAACVEECRALLPEMRGDPGAHASLLLILGHSYLGVRDKAAARKCYEAVVAMPGVEEEVMRIAKQGMSTCAQ
jgi:tetratricopeptide (TPR) repeat protein